MSNTIYKLHITVQFDDLSCPGDDPVSLAVSRAIHFLSGLGLVISGENRYDGVPVTVTLNRDGDKSAANLLAPVNDRHWKHGKIPITDVIKDD